MSLVIASTLIVIVSVLGVQVPLVIVHTNVFTPVVKPVTPLVGLSLELLLLRFLLLLSNAPVPTVGALAAKVAVAATNRLIRACCRCGW